MKISMKPKIESYIKDLREIYRAMDTSYGDVAAHYAFNCRGCNDNCCDQRFQHRTLVEYYCLLEGVKQIDSGLLSKILAKASKTFEAYKKDEQNGSVTGVMCPVNFEGLCALYEYRPMICRLHGLPHEFTRPDGIVVQSGGCRRFDAGNSANLRLNRTPHYRNLSLLEKQVRSELGFHGRYMKTTAEMLLDISEEIGISVRLLTRKTK